MAAEIARETESLTRELEKWEHQLAATRDWMAQLPEGAAQARDLAQKDVDGKADWVQKMREAKAWEF